MRDMFDEIFTRATIDPMEAARKGMRAPLRKRFYREAGVGPAAEQGFRVLLDSRTVCTPAGRVLAAPGQTLAAAITAEWATQDNLIDPARMPLTRLANSIIDEVGAARAAVKAEVGKYLGSDLLFYRAHEPPGLVARQAEHWDPVLAWAHEALGARFMLAEGVVFLAQPERAVAAAAAAIPDEPWRLGAVHAITTLTGSALLALAVLRGRLGAEEAWTAAHVDEDWQMEKWGRDALALERRVFRCDEMQAAATVLRLA